MLLHGAMGSRPILSLLVDDDDDDELVGKLGPAQHARSERTEVIHPELLVELRADAARVPRMGVLELAAEDVVFEEDDDGDDAETLLWFKGSDEGVVFDLNPLKEPEGAARA